MLTVVEAEQLVPDPKAPLHEWIPLDKLLILPEPRVPPEITVVCPPRTGRVAIPELGVIALWVASPA